MNIPERVGNHPSKIYSFFLIYRNLNNMKAEELIKNNALQDIEVAGKQKVVFEEIALTAVNMARKEERERAFKELEFILDEWVHGGDAECILGEFKEKLNHGKPV